MSEGRRKSDYADQSLSDYAGQDNRVSEMNDITLGAARPCRFTPCVSVRRPHSNTFIVTSKGKRRLHWSVDYLFGSLASATVARALI